MSMLLRPLLGFATVIVLAGGLIAEEKKPLSTAEFEAQLRQLEKDIAKVRGLEFKKPVVVKYLPRGGTDKAGVNGYYDLKDKTLYIYEDVKANYKRGVLVHEMIHALQDQHFNLKNLHEQQFASDGELALAALIEGDATFTMIELLKKEQPRIGIMMETSLETARNLQNAFLYAQGARYVRALKERGGWEAVNRAYKFTPDCTADILHPNERISTMNLGPGKNVGEYGIIAMLSELPQTKPLAVQAAAGWRGDRKVIDAQGQAWLVAFAGVEEAKRFHHALAQHIQARNPEAKSISDDPAGPVWQSPAGGVRAVFVRGTRVLDLAASDLAGLKVVRDRLDGPPAVEIYSRKQGSNVSFGEMIDGLLQADVICIGESHDEDLHHQVQLQIIRSLHARDDRLGVGMEMFQRPYQKQIDQYFQGEMSEKVFLEASEYQKRWGFEWTLYRPIVEFCRKNGVPLAALNLSTELRRRLSSAGHDKLTDDEKKQLGPIDFHVKEHRDYWYERLARMHGQTNATPEQKERGYQVMTTWDEYMADSAARFQKERQLRRMVVLAGSGHVDRGFGIPQRAAKRTGGQVATVKIETRGDKPTKIDGEPLADYTIFVR